MTKFVQALERWNARFASPEYVFGSTPNDYLKAQKNRLQPGTALAIADSEGRNSVWLARQGLQVDAFDFSPIGISKAQQLAKTQGATVNFHCCDWQNFSWQKNAYDNVVGIFFQFADPQDRAQIFARIDDCLKPGGLLILQGYGEGQMAFKTGGPGVLENLYTEALLKMSFASYDIVESITYEREIQEGVGHAGMSALIGFVATKPLDTKI